MDKSERGINLNEILHRYRQASKTAKQVILDEFCTICDYHRKYTIWLLSQPARRPRPAHRPGPRVRYGHEALRPALKPL